MDTIYDFGTGDGSTPLAPVLGSDRGTMFMSCPRSCRVDVREHNSSDLLRFGQCDTAAGRTAVELEQIRRWLAHRGLSLDGGIITAEAIIGARDADWAEAVEIERFTAWDQATPDA